MWDEIRFRYPHGRMIIYMDTFFPATAANIRKLYRSMEQSYDADVDQLVDLILEHFDKRSVRIEKDIRKAANDFAESKSAYEEKKAQYSAGKKANGVPIRKEERRAWKGDIQKLNEHWRGNKRHYDQLMSEQKKLSQNRLLLLTLNGRC